MLSRLFEDGGVVFDPSDGRTYFLPLDTFETLSTLSRLIRPGVTDVESLIEEAIETIDGPGTLVEPDESSRSASNLRHWAGLALRLNGH